MKRIWCRFCALLIFTLLNQRISASGGSQPSASSTSRHNNPYPDHESSGNDLQHRNPKGLSSAITAEDVPQDLLPQGWGAVQTTENPPRTYYYHYATRRTQWNRPDFPPPQPQYSDHLESRDYSESRLKVEQGEYAAVNENSSDDDAARNRRLSQETNYNSSNLNLQNDSFAVQNLDDSSGEECEDQTQGHFEGSDSNQQNKLGDQLQEKSNADPFNLTHSMAQTRTAEPKLNSNHFESNVFQTPAEEDNSSTSIYNEDHLSLSSGPTPQKFPFTESNSHHSLNLDSYPKHERDGKKDYSKFQNSDFPQSMTQSNTGTNPSHDYQSKGFHSNMGPYEDQQQQNYLSNVQSSRTNLYPGSSTTFENTAIRPNIGTNIQNSVAASEGFPPFRSTFQDHSASNQNSKFQNMDSHPSRNRQEQGFYIPPQGNQYESKYYRRPEPNQRHYSNQTPIQSQWTSSFQDQSSNGDFSHPYSHPNPYQSHHYDEYGQPILHRERQWNNYEGSQQNLGALVPAGSFRESRHYSVRETGLGLVRGAWGRILVGKDHSSAWLNVAKDKVSSGAALASTGIASLTYSAGSRVLQGVEGVTSRVGTFFESRPTNPGLQEPYDERFSPPGRYGGRPSQGHYANDPYQSYREEQMQQQGFSGESYFQNGNSRNDLRERNDMHLPSQGFPENRDYRGPEYEQRQEWNSGGNEPRDLPGYRNANLDADNRYRGFYGAPGSRRGGT